MSPEACPSHTAAYHSLPAACHCPPEACQYSPASYLPTAAETGQFGLRSVRPRVSSAWVSSAIESVWPESVRPLSFFTLNFFILLHCSFDIIFILTYWFFGVHINT